MLQSNLTFKTKICIFLFTVFFSSNDLFLFNNFCFVMFLQLWHHVKQTHYCWVKVFFSRPSLMGTAFDQILTFQSLKVSLDDALNCS